MRRNLFLASGLCVALMGLWLACSNDEPVAPETSAGTSSGEPNSPGLYLAPIEGLTTAWHPLPAQIAVPRDIVLTFRYVGPPDATITWDGAELVNQGPGFSIASCPAAVPGVMGVTVHVAHPSGDRSRSSRIEVVDVSASEIAVRDIALHAPQPDFGGHTKPGKDPGVQGTSINEMTMELFFKDESIGSVVEISPGRYVTSIRQALELHVDVDPPALASLTEWRIDGRATTLGANASAWLADRGTYQIAVGPTKNPRQATVETYSVEITSHVSDVDKVREDEPVTFTAETSPRGYETYVTWLASTKFGATNPIMGEGPSFTVTFSSTWGWDPDAGARAQWLGVRADHVVFNQDQKDCTPQTAYDEALAAAQAGVSAGWLPQATLDYLIQNEPVLSSDIDALWNAIGVASAIPASPTGGRALLDGGIVAGATWILESLVGLDVGTLAPQISWNNNSDPCVNEISGDTYSGNVLLGSASVQQVGATFTRQCPPTDTCPSGSTQECANFQVCYVQRLLFCKLSSGCCPLETLCAPCPI